MIRGAILTVVVAMTLSGAPLQGAPSAPPYLLLATTTSVYDTGLLTILRQGFEAESGHRVRAVAVGSGRALAMGRTGDADVLLVHDPVAEEAFMASGAGVRRRTVMHNHFLILGPAADEARVAAATSAADALRRMAAANAPFVSRGDRSGTHARELSLLRAAGVDPATWGRRRETGQGMAATLRVADELGAYVLSDVATWLALQRTLDLRPLVEGAPELVNVYSVIELPAGPDRQPLPGARAFADYLLRPDVQEVIGAFGRDRFGRSLFVPGPPAAGAPAPR